MFFETVVISKSVMMNTEVNNIFFKIAEDPELLNHIQKKLYDPWRETPFQGYRYLDNKQKGDYGELFVSKYMRMLGHDVKDTRLNNGGHDRIINDHLVEIKFSLAHTDHKKQCVKPDTFTMNHVSLEKDWERLIFVGINPQSHESHIKFITKQSFAELLVNNQEEFRKYFGRQQGGKKSNNDDYISSESKLRSLLNSKHMKMINQW